MLMIYLAMYLKDPGIIEWSMQTYLSTLEAMQVMAVMTIVIVVGALGVYIYMRRQVRI
jgi:hypothetical protein